GIYKSTDAGKTWTHIGLPASQYIGGIVVDPHNADTLLWAAMGPRPVPVRTGPAAARPTAVASSAHGEPEEPEAEAEEEDDADAPEGPEGPAPPAAAEAASGR